MIAMQIIDISLPISPDMPTYPGDPVTQFEPIRKPSGSRLTVVTLGSHAGTHIDAPSHALEDGGSIDAFELEHFYGPCRVLDMSTVDEVVKAEDLQAKNIQSGERILIKTKNSARGYAEFYDSWIAISTDAAVYLAERGVALVGIDWFGIKQKGALDNGAHTALLGKGIPILEGIDLSAAQESTYTLAAFPVAYKGTDGAPTRAVLVSE
jgi:arylformamidase